MRPRCPDGTEALDDLSGFEAVHDEPKGSGSGDNRKHEDLYPEREQFAVEPYIVFDVVNTEGHKYFIDIGKRSASRRGN